MNSKPLLKFKNKKTQISIIYILSKHIRNSRLRKYKSLNKRSLQLFLRKILRFPRYQITGALAILKIFEEEKALIHFIFNFFKKIRIYWIPRKLFNLHRLMINLKLTLTYLKYFNRTKEKRNNTFCQKIKSRMIRI